MKYALEIVDLCKSYGTFAVKDASFSLPTGSIMGFVGPNGAGKTTTLKSILNMLIYDSGEIRILGETDRKKVKDDIGVVMDNTFYEDEWRLYDVEKAMRLFSARWDSAAFDRHLAAFGLDKNKRVEDLSRGMGVKLTIAAALSHDAKLLILDEPTSGLDPVARDELCEILLDYVKDNNRSILFSTHITSDLEKIADYITFIMDGKITFSGSIQDVYSNFRPIYGENVNLDDIVVRMAKEGRKSR